MSTHEDDCWFVETNYLRGHEERVVLTDQACTDCLTAWSRTDEMDLTEEQRNSIADELGGYL